MVNDRDTAIGKKTITSTSIAATTMPPYDRRILPASLTQAKVDGLQQTRLLDFDQLTSPVIRTAISYWMSRQENGAPMKKCAFDATEIPHLLPYLMLLEVVPVDAASRLDFRYRVIGDVLLRYFRGNHTGKCFSDIEGQGPGSEVWRICTNVATQCLPLLACPPYVGPHQQIYYCEAATMPLVDENGRPVRLLIACDFLPDISAQHLRHRAFALHSGGQA